MLSFFICFIILVFLVIPLTYAGTVFTNAQKEGQRRFERLLEMEEEIK